MRPEILFPLAAPVESLPGIGPRLAKLVEKAAGPRVADLLWHLPSGIVDRRFAPPVAEAPAGRVVTLTLIIDGHFPSSNNRRPHRILAHDESGSIELVFFHARKDWLERLAPVGSTRVVSGTVERFDGQPRMAHPDHVLDPGDLDQLRRVEPVYALATGLPAKVMGKAVRSALGRAPILPDWLDPALKGRESWEDWHLSLAMAHAPEDVAALEPTNAVRRRLAYDELLADQLAIAILRADSRRRRGRETAGDGRLREALIAALPFSLTGAQRLALAEIEADMAAPRAMLRLLQGDVGSGKTLVALAAMLNAVETGAQAALLAPTEILARQHLATIDRFCPAGVRIDLLTGRDKGSRRQAALERLASGETDIVVGTHALVQESVGFRDLALAVVDEQHRFGVEQRLQLARKGKGVDILAMTATPIPRTLIMTSYGDLDVSLLKDKPAGRQPITTRIVSVERLEETVEAIGRALAAEAKVYWICPLVEESETLDVAAATQRHGELLRRFGHRVGMVHGKMPATDRDRVMAGFCGKGESSLIDLLVATTVVEVGVDVPEATIMVIEHAERFGLAQLHQLRGRIGRGDKPSTCLLLYQTPLGAGAKERLTTLRDTDDGFVIAEADLRLRGPGDVLGTRQSGVASYRLADLAHHGDLLEVAEADARLVLARDPDLSSPRGQALRTLLYLFGRDQAAQYLRSG